MRIGVLASGSGTILESLLAAGLPVVAVVVDRPCRAEEVAAGAGVPVELVKRDSFGASFDREAYTDEVVAVLAAHRVDLVAMAGYGTILGASIHEAYRGRILNTHPALLPAFRGWHAVRAALDAGVKVTGCTVHVATLEVDDGPILAQEAVAVLPGDDEASLHERIKEVERRLYPETIRRIVAGELVLPAVSMPISGGRAGAGPVPVAVPVPVAGAGAGRRRRRRRPRTGGGPVRALLSVYDKTGLVAFAGGLADLGVELVASGNTARALGEAGIAHLEVAEVTGAPEMLDGRVKTLHPAVHGGILADRSKPSHMSDLEARGITPVDLVACNLYPFSANPSIEMIDVGGPTMVRAAAKNHDSVTVIVSPDEYGAVLDELRREGEVTLETRRRLARAAFAHTAAYDAAIVGWFDSTVLPQETSEGAREWPPTIHIALERAGTLRYGENPHQAGARYRTIGAAPGWPDGLVQHGGLALSYLNLFDADAAWRLAHELVGLGGGRAGLAAAVIVKHANPCGAAVADDIGTAYAKAFEADPMSAFGGIVALTEAVSGELAAQLVANPLADVLIAPAFSDEALSTFSSKRKNMRALTAPPPGPPGLGLRQIDGGFLVQEADLVAADRSSWRVAGKVSPTEEQWRDAELAWRVCARTTSNAIVLGRAGQILGVGCGQQSRVEAAVVAARKADGRAAGGAAASDAFFPFRDGVDALAAAGVATIIQPGGSLRDDESIAAADEHGIAMVMTGERHFRH